MQQSEINLFSYVLPKYKITKPIRLIELFAGIGSQAKALKKIGVKFEHWKVVEIDEHALNSYNAIHQTNFTPQDITRIHSEHLEMRERESYTYILTYSFPCQDLSLAGKLKGMAKGSQTRSGLLWEVERILEECKGELPHILLMENVPQVIGKKNIKDFQLWRSKLESLGYSNYVQLLNAKNYGIPQNRNRCFMVSILGDYYYEFPKKQKLNLKLKDMLESNVDEKYYISKQMQEGMQKTNFNQYSLEHSFIERERESKSIIARYEGAPQVITVFPEDEETLKQQLANKLIKNKLVDEGDVIRHSYTNNRMNDWENRGKQIKDNSLSPTIDTRCDCLGVVVNDKLQIKENTKKGYTEANEGDGVYINRPHQKRGVVQKDMIQTIKANCNDIGVVVEDEE